MDFYTVVVSEKKDGTLQIRPDWKVGRSTDLMTRGGQFYAIWDEDQGLWSQDIYDVQRLVDEDLVRQAQRVESERGTKCAIARLAVDSTKLWDSFQRFVRNSGDNYHNLDEKLIFANTNVKKEDYASRRLAYSLAKGPHPAWDSIVGTLYNEEERAKIEWAIGAIVSGDSKNIQKFFVFYGPPGSGKSTIMNIIQKLFSGYTSIFDARELAASNNTFATAAFKSNPLVAIQHDGDLSRIYDNTKLNSIVAHEPMTINEKYRTPFETKAKAFLFMGTNLPVKITDAKAGILRRLIDVVPTQQTIEHEAYFKLMNQVEFELGAIAHHCLERYKRMGSNYYSTYRPVDMMMQTDVFYNYVESCFDVFRDSPGISLKRAWSLYKEYCADTGIDKILPQYKFREELKNYFENFEQRARVDGNIVSSYYSGFKNLSPTTSMPVKPEGVYKIELFDGPSRFDELYPGLPAQYAKEDGTPAKPWANVKTTLADIDTSQLHWVKVPENHIVIDFDLVDEDGNKSIGRNIMEAERWPPTYAEVSKSGRGIHLHYLYTGDVRELSSVYDVGVEIKTLLDGQALRRKLTKSNHVNITPIEHGLPKKEKPLLSNQSIQSERGLRTLIAKNLKKEIHPGTKPSVDFIKTILDQAYESGMPYDVLDMRPDILAFAIRSTHQSDTCIKLVQQMKFASESPMPTVTVKNEDSPIVFFDVEVYPNLLVVCWKFQGSDEVVRMINPEPKDVEELFSMKLVGFNNRRYDNHILYARYLGYDLGEIYKLSMQMTGDRKTQRPDIYFGEAYNISYTDIFDFSSKKQGLKRFGIEMGLHHMELDLPYDKPVPEELWDRVVDYCVNDVIVTEATFEDRKQDFVARQILAELSGLSVNHTTQNHTAKIIFGDEKNPQRSFIYTDLSNQFPGYEFDGKTSSYLGENPSEGGYVYAEPGMYENVALLDVASMHPASIEALNLFGPYTERFSELKSARMAIKHRNYEKAREMLDGKLQPYLTDEQGAEELAYALKIVINIVYGLTSASFPNPFRDGRNKDNIVAKRGALFMINLKNEVQARGFTVAHIKTDSIKIPHATEELIKFIFEYGLLYGYDFEHEITYDKFCLVNDAVYIAKAGDKWTAVGAQFQHPYVFKTLFSGEEIEFDDFCEVRNVVKGTMYLDFSGTGEVESMIHVGKTGSFVPVMNDGGDLWRINEEGKYAVSGTKGFKWITRDIAVNREAKNELQINFEYFEDLKRKAHDEITKYTTPDHIDWFIS